MTLADELQIDVNGTVIPNKRWSLPDIIKGQVIRISTEGTIGTDDCHFWMNGLCLRAPIGTPPLRIGWNEIGFRRTVISPMKQTIKIGEIEIVVTPSWSKTKPPFKVT